MCGICGLVALDGRLDPLVLQALPAMAASLRHRGPDGDGFFADERVGLAHRRLAIIDLAGGDQPIANEDRSCWIVFNGEIYNHRALRHDLTGRGHVFRTASDTEAILHAYEEYGAACVERLEGMFAFAIYDKRRGSLFLARDRLGKKPLFYAVLGGVLHFASEMKAFYASPAWEGTPRGDGLEEYFSLGYFLAPQTVYRDVRKLEPGHWLLLRDGQVEVRQYWDVEEFDTDRRPVPEVLEDLEGVLRDAVRDRLESEVPLGAFLSGGIDSGLVVSFMAERRVGKVVTTSVGFGGDEANELPAAGITASHFVTQHHASTLDPLLEEVLAPIADAFDEPFADSSAIPTWYVSKAARRHVTVALSGDGGDESFSGYDFRYVPHALESLARHLVPGAAGRAAAAGLGRWWPRSGRMPRFLRLGTVFENLAYNQADAYYADLCAMKPAAARRLLGRRPDPDPRQSPVYAAVTGPYRRCPSSSAVQRAEYADLKVYLPNDPLVKVDRMSMQHSLEVRCPLLDRRVVEFAFRLPVSLKMKGLEGKYLLRRLAARRLPPALARLPKRGFTAPIGAWLAGPYADRFVAEVLSPASTIGSLLDLAELRRLFDANRRGRPGCAHALWAAWMFERWSRRQVEVKTTCGRRHVCAAAAVAGIANPGGEREVRS